MKSITLITIAFLLSFSIISCKNKNQMRVRNSFSNPMKVVVGATDFGSVNTGKTTEYKNISKGRQEITGDISAAITVPDRGKHKYTLVINTVGHISLVEEDN